MLTEQKKKFADCLRKGLSKTDAARMAGYSDKSAASRGSQLSRDEYVLAYIQRLDEKDRKTKKSAQAVAEMNVQPDPPGPEPVPATMPPLIATQGSTDPLDMMRRIMILNEQVDPKLSLEAAKALAPYEHAKKGEDGKKEQRLTAAKRSSATFSRMKTPGLKAV